MGATPFSKGILDWYNSDNAKFKPEYAVWKSGVNGGMAVLVYWTDTNINQPKLRLAYVSDHGDEHFARMAELGAFGQEAAAMEKDGMEGL